LINVRKKYYANHPIFVSNINYNHVMTMLLCMTLLLPASSTDERSPAVNMTPHFP
jgi:hypothetical protein